MDTNYHTPQVVNQMLIMDTNYHRHKNKIHADNGHKASQK